MTSGTQGNRAGDGRRGGSERDARRYYRLRRQRYAEMAFERTPFEEAEHELEEAEHAAALAQRDERIEQLTKDSAALRDLALRARADLENGRKRFQREKAETVKFAAENLVRDLVPVLDNLARALGSIGEAPEVQPLYEGVRMVMDLFQSVLTANGLEVIDPTGQPFDPHYHEAVAAEEREDLPDNQIIDTFQCGYVLRGRVVRPAMVRVARAPRREEPAPAGEEGITREKRTKETIPSGEELFEEAMAANDSPDDESGTTRADAASEAMASRENPDDLDELPEETPGR